MKQRFGLIRRAWGVLYAKDKLTGRQESLDTRNRQEALRILHAKNEAELQPMINLQMARAYLSATDPAAAARTWQFVMDEAAKTKHKATLDRWRVAMKDPHFEPMRPSSGSRHP